jgi:hypothetical protein
MRFGHAPYTRWPSMSTFMSRLCSPRSTTSLAMAPLRSRHTPAVSASASPTSRAALSRTSVVSMLSRGIAAATVTCSVTVAGASVMATRWVAPPGTTTDDTSRCSKPGASMWMS